MMGWRIVVGSPFPPPRYSNTSQSRFKKILLHSISDIGISQDFSKLAKFFNVISGNTDWIKRPVVFISHGIELPRDVIFLIISFLPFREVIKARSICKDILNFVERLPVVNKAFIYLNVYEQKEKKFCALIQVIKRFECQILDTIRDVESCRSDSLARSMHSICPYVDLRSVLLRDDNFDRKHICSESILRGYLALVKICALKLKDFSEEKKRLEPLVNRCFCPQDYLKSTLALLMNGSYDKVFITLSLASGIKRCDKFLVLKAVVISYCLEKNFKAANDLIANAKNFFMEDEIYSLHKEIEFCQGSFPNPKMLSVYKKATF